MLSEIVSGLLTWAMSLIQIYGPYSVFIAVLLEELLLPMPAPLVIMGASVLLIDPTLPFFDALPRMFFLIVLPAAFASTIGSFFTYGIGYFGGRPLITRFRESLRISWLDVERFDKRLEKGKKVWTTIAALRAIPFFPIAFVSLSAGILRLSWKKFAVATFIGAVVRTLILAVVGWRIGTAYTNLAYKLDVIENIIAIVIILLVIYLLHKYRHKYVHHYRRIIEKTSQLRKRHIHRYRSRI